MDAETTAGRCSRDDSWRRQVNWWLLLLSPLAIAAAIVWSRIDPKGFNLLQKQLETPAPYLVALAGAVYAIRAVRTRNPLYAIMTAFVVSLTLREIHWDWTHRGIYVLLAGVGAWTFIWRRRIAEPLKDWRHTSWLMATLAAYVISQMIAKRWFKFVPGEQPIHRSLEECAETAAHVMLIVTSLVGSWRRKANVYLEETSRDAGDTRDKE